MKKRLLSFIKLRWLLVLTVAALVGTMTMIGYAEYEFESNYMKRVVVASSDHGMMFSSNYLIEGGSKTYQSKTESGSAPYEVRVYLWNYSLKNTTQCYPGEIGYSVSFRVTDNRGNNITDTGVFVGSDPQDPDTPVYKTIEVKDNQGTTVHTFSSSDDLTTDFSISGETLGGDGNADQKMYTLVFNNWDLSTDKDVCVQMIATPSSDLKDLRPIAAVIGLRETVPEEPNVWQAKISELEDERSNVDGYNLVLTGSGKADIVISWDTTKVDLNKYFGSGNTYNLFTGEIEPAPGGTPVISGDWQTVTIHADASAFRNRYNLQLYLSAGLRPADDTFFAEASSSDAASAWITYNITTTSE